MSMTNEEIMIQLCENYIIELFTEHDKEKLIYSKLLKLETIDENELNKWIETYLIEYICYDNNFNDGDIELKINTFNNFSEWYVLSSYYSFEIFKDDSQKIINKLFKNDKDCCLDGAYFKDGIDCHLDLIKRIFDAYIETLIHNMSIDELKLYIINLIDPIVNTIELK